MLVGQKALRMTILVLGATVLVVLICFHTQLYSLSDDDRVTPLYAHFLAQSFSLHSNDAYKDKHILAHLPGSEGSSKQVDPEITEVIVSSQQDVYKMPEMSVSEKLPDSIAAGRNAYTKNGHSANSVLNVSAAQVDSKLPPTNVTTKLVDATKPVIITASAAPFPDTHPKMSNRVIPMVHNHSLAQASRGYVFSVVYWEQLASSACNIMSLQCWAGSQTPPMLVVQPYYSNGWPRTVPYPSRVVTLSDLLDVDRWNAVSSRENYATLVNWRQYRANAPRDLIIVKVIYWWLNTSDSRGIDRNSRLESGCSDEYFQIADNFFTVFTVVRKVCINLSYGDILTLEEFNSRIFGGFSPGSVSVIFKEWRGISARNKFRIIMNDSHCEWHYVPMRHAWSPSAKIKVAAGQYIERFLRNSEYVALMLRLEWAVRGHNMTYLNDVLTRVLGKLDDVQKRAGTNITFLTADVGRFGSSTLGASSSILWTAFTGFFEQLFNDTMSVTQWENSFELISGTEDHDFIAMLQSTVVSRAKCVIFVGHGNFQKHTKFMYEELHGNEPTHCVEHIH